MFFSFPVKSKNSFNRLFLIVAAAIFFMLAPCCYAEKERNSILVLHSYNHTYVWTKDVQTGIEKVLSPDTELFVFHLDANRLDLDKFEDIYCEMILRAGPEKFKAVICTDDPALNFVFKYQNQIFKKMPIVFCGANSFNTERLANTVNITGVNEEISLEENLSSIIALRPSMKNLAVIGDLTVTGQRNLNLFRQLVEKNNYGLKIVYLDNHMPAELILALKQLRPDDAVLYLSYLKTPEGKTLTPEESCNLVLEASPAPVFGCWDFLIGTGFVGGKVACAHRQGEAAASMIKRLFQGIPVSQLPVQMESPNQFIFDYTALKLHRIDISRLPQNSILINMPEKNWWSYWRWFAAGIIILFLETTLIIMLIRSKRLVVFEEARHQAMLANTAGVIAVIDAQGINRYKSANVEKIFGWKPEELVGKSTWQIVHPDDLTATQAVFTELLTDAALQKTALCRYLCKDGSYKWIEFTAANHLENDLIKGVLLNYHDVSQRIAAQEEQKNLEKQLQQTQRLESLGVLAGGIAHDFNNLLMAIQGYSELTISDIPSDSIAIKYLNEIQKATNRAAELCRQMLAYSGRANFIKETVDLHRMVKEMTELLQASVTRKSRLVFETSGEAPIIYADVAQINQVIMNLVINASEAINHSSGEIRICTAIVECSSDELRSQYIDSELPSGRYACLEVSDNGCGMSEDTLERLFDPFFTTKFTGRGLGMSAILGIVRSHMGTLKVCSKPGEGSVFRIYFPVAESCLVKTLKENHDERILIPSGAMVMVVDDEESVRKVVQKVLEILGLKVILAADGVEAVEIFRQNRESIELVLLDLTMPRKDGYETLLELRSLKPDLRIIVASGYGEHELQKKFGSRSRLGFINKPYSIELIKNELSRLFCEP